MGTKANSIRAREAILAAAIEAFAELGYERATVRDICCRAGVNLASINYHFGSKEGLYVTVLKSLQSPTEPDFDGHDNPEDALRAILRFFLVQSIEREEAPLAARLMAMEMSHPTAGLDALVKDLIRPRFERLRSVMEQLLGSCATPESVDAFAFSVISQAVFYRHSRPLVERLTQRRHSSKELEELAEHIHRVVMAGVAAERQRLATPALTATGGS